MAMKPVPVEDRLDQLIKIARDHTPEDFRGNIEEVVREFGDTFSLKQEPPGFCNLQPVQIDTGEAAPVQGPAYRIPICQQPEVARQLGELLENEIISYSSSPWRSPMVVVKKKDGSLRLCVDYRRLNRVTKDDCFPLPSIEEILCKLKGNVYFSSLDLKQGYYQIGMDPSAQPKTTFVAMD